MSRPTSTDRALTSALFAVVQGSRHALKDPVDRVTASVLADVRRLGPVRPSELADQMRLDLSTVSRHITSLVERGLLERTADPEDARAQLVRLTPDGEAVLDHHPRRARDGARRSGPALVGRRPSAC